MDASGKQFPFAADVVLRIAFDTTTVPDIFHAEIGVAVGFVTFQPRLQHALFLVCRVPGDIPLNNMDVYFCHVFLVLYYTHKHVGKSTYKKYFYLMK